MVIPVQSALLILTIAVSLFFSFIILVLLNLVYIYKKKSPPKILEKIRKPFLVIIYAFVVLFVVLYLESIIRSPMILLVLIFVPILLRTKRFGIPKKITKKQFYLIILLYYFLVGYNQYN